MSHYATLGLHPEASDDEIRLAYHRLARVWHPDYYANRSPGARAEASRRMQELNAAWHVLSDPRRRAAYDRDSGQRHRFDDGPVRVRAGTVAAGPDWSMIEDDDDLSEEERTQMWREPPGGLDGGPPPPGGRLVVVPVASIAGAMVSGVLWFILGFPVLLAASLILGAVALVLFLAVPLVALVGARRHDS
ncbi:MAG TPA: J domain-containing protein [Acidimicrobiales bacterium]|jgi:hypothetical protein